MTTSKHILHAGIAQAQFSLGQYHYEHGHHGDAERLFRSAAASGNMQAKYQLAVMNYDGVGVAEDQVRGVAMELFYVFSVFVSMKNSNFSVIEVFTPSSSSLHPLALSHPSLFTPSPPSLLPLSSLPPSLLPPSLSPSFPLSSPLSLRVSP